MRRNKPKQYRIQDGANTIVAAPADLNLIERAVFFLVPTREARVWDGRTMELRDVKFKYALGKLQIVSDQLA